MYFHSIEAVAMIEQFIPEFVGVIHVSVEVGETGLGDEFIFFSLSRGLLLALKSKIQMLELEWFHDLVVVFVLVSYREDGDSLLLDLPLEADFLETGDDVLVGGVLLFLVLDADPDFIAWVFLEDEIQDGVEHLPQIKGGEVGDEEASLVDTRLVEMGLAEGNELSPTREASDAEALAELLDVLEERVVVGAETLFELLVECLEVLL